MEAYILPGIVVAIALWFGIRSIPQGRKDHRRADWFERFMDDQRD